MGTISEERKRERPSRIALIISLLSLIPFLGAIFIVPAILGAVFLLFYCRKKPEKLGGVYRLRIALLISFVALALQMTLFYIFFRFKIEQAEEVKYKITVMRLYCAAEALENYEKEKGVYPEGLSSDEIEKALEEAKILHIPFKDGWERGLIVKSKLWDYHLTAEPPPKDNRKRFPLLKAQNPKPVFPYIGGSLEYENLILK
ncbi:MAG: DMT family transporter [Acidobacteria bacterium]|nr:DMT family transporter [Acidobacteriota bacterium]